MMMPSIDGGSTISQTDSDSTVIFIYLQKDQRTLKKTEFMGSLFFNFIQ